jgi:hypothetical protein
VEIDYGLPRECAWFEVGQEITLSDAELHLTARTALVISSAHVDGERVVVTLRLIENPPRDRHL